MIIAILGVVSVTAAVYAVHKHYTLAQIKTKISAEIKTVTTTASADAQALATKIKSLL